MLSKKAKEKRLAYVIKNFDFEGILDKIREFKGIKTAESTRAWTKKGEDCVIYVVRNEKSQRFSSMIILDDLILEKYKEIDNKLLYLEKATVYDSLFIASYKSKLCELHEMREYLTKHFKDESTAAGEKG